MKYRVIFFSLLLGIIFSLGSVTSVHAAQSGKGWYYDGNLITDTGCPTWRAEAVSIRDANTNDLITADSLDFFIKYWKDLNGDGDFSDPGEVTLAYSTTQTNVSSFLTPCIADGPAGSETSLEIINVVEPGYETIRSMGWAHLRNDLIQKRWQRYIFMAPTSNPINTAHVFPVDDAILTNPNVDFQVYIDKRPAANDIVDLGLFIVNTDVPWASTPAIDPVINTGTVTFPTITLPDGRYNWYVWFQIDDAEYFYDFIFPGDYFYLDTIPPTVSADHSPALPTNIDVVTISGTAQDTTVGLDKIEVFLDGGLVKTCTYVGEVRSSQTCDAPTGPFAAGSIHTYFARATDHAGRQATSPTGSFTVSSTGPVVVGQMRVQGPAGIIILPLFNITDPGLTNSALRINTPGGVRAFDVLPIAHPNASSVIIQTPAGVRAIRKL